MFPSPRTRTPQSDTHTSTQNNVSSSRSSGFSRFLKRASPGSIAVDTSRADERDLSASLNENAKPLTRRAFEEDRFGRDRGQSRDESGRSDTGMRKSFSSSQLNSPSTSRNTFTRGSPLSQAQTTNHRPSSRASTTDHVHSAITPSPQTRYGPSASSHAAYTTSSPSPLARRSESRQSLYSASAAAPRPSVSHQLRRSQSRQSASSSSAPSLVFNDPRDQRTVEHSRATTPRPGDFHTAAANADYDNTHHPGTRADFAFSDDSGDDDDYEQEEEQSTTPRSELKRWRPSVVSATGNTFDKSTRYASEPPACPDDRASTSIGGHAGGAAERVRRSSLSYPPIVRNGQEDYGVELEPEDKVEMWRSGPRAALPTEFRNDFSPLAHGKTSASRYSSGRSSGIDESPEYPARGGDQAAHAGTRYATRHQRASQSITSSLLSYTQSPIRRSESLHFSQPHQQNDEPIADPSASTSSMKRSTTLHAHARNATESIASPLRARLGLVTSARSRLGTSEVGDDPSSPVVLQRAESRRRRAALLQEMSTANPPAAAMVVTTPNRPASRMTHDRYALTDARPTSRMSIANGAGMGIRPSTSMSSFRASDPSVGGMDGQGYRSPIGSSFRGHNATRSTHEAAYSPSSRWLRDHVPGPSPSRHERKSSGRASSPTKSVVSSVIPPAGTSSRIVINRLLAALRESTGQETRKMLQACIALQQNLAGRPAGDDEDDAEVQQFKQSCQTVAIDANQINANLKAALDIVTRLGDECEASSAEDAQIATISAVQKLGELIGSSSRASDEKIKSLQMVFDRLGNYTDRAASVPSHVENVVDNLPIVQEDTEAVEAGGVVGMKDDVDEDVEAVEKVVEPVQASVEPEMSTTEGTNVPESTSLEITPHPTASLVAREEPVVTSEISTLESVPLPLQDTPVDTTSSAPTEETAASVPAPSSTDISPAQLRTRARKASSSNISVNLSPSNSSKPMRSPLPPTLTHKASFMPSSLSLRTPTTALSRINAGTADEPGFDFDTNPKSKAVVDATFRLNPLQLEIRTTPTAGRGVFATDDIPTAGTVVEESPVLVLTKKEWDDGLLNDGVLGGYGFNWTAGGMGVGLGIGEKLAVVSSGIVLMIVPLTLASMFNHSPQPNVMFTRIAPRESEKEKYPTLIFRTTKPIKKGDELYICYSADESKLWFSPNYNAHGNPVESTPEDSEWCPPMMDEENEPAGSEGPVQDVDADERPKEASTADATPSKPTSTQNGTENEQAGDQKYLDRKARKQSKREKKMKKPKADDTPVLQESAPETPAEPGQSIAASESEATNAGDPDSPLSPDDYASALSKLDLIPEIEIQAEDIERERALAGKDESSTEGKQSRNDEVAWKLVHRVRGLVEAQEGDEDRTVDIWALAILDKKLMPVVLKYLKLNEKRFGALDHVKRVNHQKDKGNTLVAIAPVDLINQDTLQSELAEFHPSLADTELMSTIVPATFGRTLEDVAGKAKIWPVLLNAVPKHPADTAWSMPRRAWVRKGIHRLVQLAQNAKEAGELPIAALAYSAPPDAQPMDPDLIPPTVHLRARGMDRRYGSGHPLKHAAMGCVAEVARLRTCSPFTETTSSTRNGADYLLTSMSLFITHEPCVMCSMALVHSRVKEVFFLVRNGEGGFGGAFDIHGHPGLNHKIDVYDCSALVGEEVLKRLLELPEGVEP
ncbi:hypothetical protein QFC22_004571 [Naganishia vaughanmartiniae]|uniref:Uncharacterized protein n=1 Tax=Naganishia vaughanmartiniae TaxID=1424756 RepID=A0ACC2X0H0_9TREE|nr:hypothetical protein QFC22_004571 [Naganishia vaughanmartiniae]